ncbi:hypothetical protein BZA77DRAFT_29649 [Pyronema omphalodes]|nr:hypothetical protein BZA77DRAFT_29649 [Pyronema omphalodes]
MRNLFFGLHFLWGWAFFTSCFWALTSQTPRFLHFTVISLYISLFTERSLNIFPFLERQFTFVFASYLLSMFIGDLPFVYLRFASHPPSSTPPLLFPCFAQTCCYLIIFICFISRVEREERIIFEVLIFMIYSSVP